MTQALVIKDETLIRTQVIGQRTDNATLAIVKAMMIENLKEKMQNGVAHFVFIKKDGCLREAWGTTNAQLVAKHTNGRGDSRERFFTTAFFDIEKGEFRSFRWESIVAVF